MVAKGANISVEALSSIQGFVGATILACTQIFRARIAIVAATFVDGSVAIIVLPVAHILTGNGRIALTQTFGPTHADATAGPEIVRLVAKGSLR